MRNVKTMISFALVLAMCMGMCSTALAKNEDLNPSAVEYQLDTGVIVA